MSTFACAFDPFPMWVNGYFCRDDGEGELARKLVDPAHPRSGPENRDAASDPTRPAPLIDAKRVNGTQRTADARLDPARQTETPQAVEAPEPKPEPVKTTTYSPTGATHVTTPPTSGQNYSIKA